MDLPPNYKLKSDLGVETWAMDTVWETSEAGTPTCAYVPIGGSYKLQYCVVSFEKIYQGLWRDENEEPNFRWKLECSDSPPDPEAFLRDDDCPYWQERRLLAIANNSELLLLESDTTRHRLLIEKAFLVETATKYIPNEFGIPAKYCRIVKKEHFFSGQNWPPGHWCEVHKNWARAPKGKCSDTVIVPNKYQPCEIEADQGGRFCLTHGNFCDGNFCESYKGPVIREKDEYGEERIPSSYQSCSISQYGPRRCYTHDSNCSPEEICCKLYNGPFKICKN